MGDAGWGITFVLGIGAMVTTILVTLAIQYFHIMRLKLELKASTLQDQAGMGHGVAEEVTA